MLRTDIARAAPRLDVPAYFFHGVHDYTCSRVLAKRYFETLEAPVKRFYEFARSAHSPIFEEPQLARKIVEDDVVRVSTKGQP